MKSEPEAIIFDMDGLLIDSEPLWSEAEKKVFATVGVELTEEMILKTRGLRPDEVVGYWYEKYSWQEPSRKELLGSLVESVIDLINKKANLLPGAMEAISLAHSMGCKVSLASSSPMGIINAVLNKFGLDNFYSVHSAENELKGKPDPAVYLTTCKKLGVEAKRCLALEDSFNGVKSAKSAGMFCIAIPAVEERDDERFKIADLKLNSLEEVNKKMILNLFN